MEARWKNVDPKLFKTPWDGWYFQNGLLWDKDGNHYTPKDIKLSWQAEQIINNKFGTSQNIYILKNHLEKQKELDTPLPYQITITWDTDKGKFSQQYKKPS